MRLLLLSMTLLFDQPLHYFLDQPILKSVDCSLHDINCQKTA